MGHNGAKVGELNDARKRGRVEKVPVNGWQGSNSWRIKWCTLTRMSGKSMVNE